jgi:multidrug resistance efflux pump
MKISQLIAAGIALILLGGCHAASENVFPGYAEGEYVRIASPYAGNLATLNVKRGDEIAAGAPLFALEQANERAWIICAKANEAKRLRPREHNLRRRMHR